jgi:hypothetical protein
MRPPKSGLACLPIVGLALLLTGCSSASNAGGSASETKDGGSLSPDATTTDGAIAPESDGAATTRSLAPSLTEPAPYEVVFLDDPQASFAQKTYAASFGTVPVTLVRVSATRVGLLTPAVTPGG